MTEHQQCTLNSSTKAKSTPLPQEYLGWHSLASSNSSHVPGFVTRVTLLVSLVQQDIFTLPVHMSSPWILSGVRFARSLVFCVMLCGSLFVLFRLALALFVLIRLMDCNYPFCIFKLVTVLIDSSFVEHIEKKASYLS